MLSFLGLRIRPRSCGVGRPICYDCTVDDAEDPSVFVTYHDAQQYPEYLVKNFQGARPRFEGALCL